MTSSILYDSLKINIGTNPNLFFQISIKACVLINTINKNLMQIYNPGYATGRDLLLKR